MSRKNKKIKLTESQLKKVILKEFVPNAVAFPRAGGIGVTTKRQREYIPPKKPKGDVEVVKFDTPQKLILNLAASPSYLEKLTADAESWFTNNWNSIDEFISEVAYLGDPDEGGNLLTDPIDTVWNFMVSYAISRGVDISDAITGFQASQNAEKIGGLKSSIAQGIDVVGSFGGSIILSSNAVDQLAEYACNLLADPTYSACFEDVITIANLLAGDRNAINAALGSGTSLGKTWNKLKNDYLKGGIEFANLSLGTKIQTGEASFENPGPCYVEKQKQIFNALEYFKFKVHRLSNTYWARYEIERNIKFKTVGGSFWGGAGGTRVIDKAASTMTLKRTSAGKQTIPSRLVTLRQFFTRDANKALSTLTQLSGKININQTSGKEKRNAIKEMELIIRDAENQGMEVKFAIDALPAAGLDITPQGSLKRIQFSSQMNEGSKRVKGLILEAPGTTNYQGNFSGYIDDLATSQTTPALPAVQEYTLQADDQGALWLGPDPDAAAFKVGKLSAKPWSGVGYREIARDIVQYMLFDQEGSKRCGSSIDKSTGTVVLPHEDSIAFYIMQMTEETGDTPRYINPLEISGLREAIIKDLTDRFPAAEYPNVFKNSPGATQTKKEEKEEDKKGDRCPKDKLKLDTASLHKIGKAARVKLLQNAINKYLTHHQLPGGPIPENGEWKASTDDGFERVVYHALMEDDNPAIGLNHPVWGGQFNGQVANKISQNWKSRADDLNLPGYVNTKKEGDITGAVAIVYDAYNCNTAYGKQDIKRPSGSGGKGTPRKVGAVKDTNAEEGKCADGSAMKKATWRDIQIQFNQKSKKFSLDKSAVDQLKIDLAKQTAAFIVNPPHSMNPVTKEHVGTFTIGIGGRIKNRKSHDWNVPDAYEKIIDKAMKNLIQKAKKDSKGLDVVRNSNIIITIPCGNYTTLAESIRQKREKDFENLLRELIKKV
jgi:hypothetical protein